MKSTHVRICLLAFVGSTALAGTVLSQPDRQVPKPVTKHGEPKMPTVEPLRPIGSIGHIIKMKNHDNPQEQAVAKLLESQIARDARVNYFKGIIDREELRLLGWHQEIVKVETLDGVEQATVRVHPIVSERNGRPVRLTGTTQEVYAVRNGNLVPLRTETQGSPTGIVRE